MSDMVSAGNGPLTLKVSGSDVVFSQLTFRDRRDVMSEHRKVKRKELKDTLTEAGVPVLDQIPDLRQFDNEIVGFDAFISLFYSHDGKDRLLAKSIDKTQPGKGDGIVAQIDWTDDETMEVCAYLCRIQLARKERQRKEGYRQAKPYGDSGPIEEPDWDRERFRVTRWLPSIGDPFDIPLGEFEKARRYIIELEDPEYFSQPEGIMARQLWKDSDRYFRIPEKQIQWLEEQKLSGEFLWKTIIL